jgi:hypothetical protein
MLAFLIGCQRHSAGLLALTGLLLLATGAALITDKLCGRQIALGAGCVVLGIGLYIDTLIEPQTLNKTGG